MKQSGFFLYLNVALLFLIKAGGLCKSESNFCLIEIAKKKKYSTIVEKRERETHVLIDELLNLYLNY